MLIHGYGGTSVFMWKILAQMAPYAHVFAIDLYGQGLSSRPNFDLTTDKYDETVEFFCGAIEEWRLQKGLTEPFSLMGHSYGGYTSI